MVQSLTAKRGLAKMRRGLGYGLAVITVGGVLVEIIVPGPAWWSALLGVGGAAVMFAISWYTTSAVLRSDHVAVGWVAGDYIAKIGLTLGILLLAKYVGVFNLAVVAGLLIAAIVVTALVQVTSFAPPPRRAVPTDIDE